MILPLIIRVTHAERRLLTNQWGNQFHWVHRLQVGRVNKAQMTLHSCLKISSAASRKRVYCLRLKIIGEYNILYKSTTGSSVASIVDVKTIATAKDFGATNLDGT